MTHSFTYRRVNIRFILPPDYRFYKSLRKLTFYIVFVTCLYLLLLVFYLHNFFLSVYLVTLKRLKAIKSAIYFFLSAFTALGNMLPSIHNFFILPDMYEKARQINEKKLIKQEMQTDYSLLSGERY